VTRKELENLLLIFSPVAPHICEEMWQNPQVQRLVGDKQIVKVVFVPGRLLNLVVK